MGAGLTPIQALIHDDFSPEGGENRTHGSAKIVIFRRCIRNTPSIQELKL